MGAPTMAPTKASKSLPPTMAPTMAAPTMAPSIQLEDPPKGTVEAPTQDPQEAAAAEAEAVAKRKRVVNAEVVTKLVDDFGQEFVDENPEVVEELVQAKMDTDEEVVAKEMEESLGENFMVDNTKLFSKVVEAKLEVEEGSD